MKNIVYYCSLCFIILLGCEPIDMNLHTKHAFSVSETEKVVFAPGNLQYIVSQDKWQFAKDQLTYLGQSNLVWGKDSNYVSDTIDLFGWGTGNHPTMSSKDYRDYTLFYDWGMNKIGHDMAGVWRTLSKQELEYLMTGRKNAVLLYGIGQVCGVNGLILLPDEWVAPKDIVFLAGYYGWNGSEYFVEHQSYDKKQWRELEKSGAVFLPAAGCRVKDFEWYEIKSIQSFGGYWTSTAMDHEDRYGHLLYFESNSIRYWAAEEKENGLSVRLVKDL